VRRRFTPIAVVLGIVLAQVLLVPLFAAPNSRIAPRDLPVVVAGPEPAAGALANQLRSQSPGAFQITRVADVAAGDAKLRAHQAYAVFVPSASGLSLRVASAASPTVAALLTQAVGEMSPGGRVEVTDVVPGAPRDPRGGGFAAGVLPLALTSLLAGVLVTLLVPGRSGRIGALVGYAVLAGLVEPLVLQNWLGVLGGGYLPVAGAIALIALAVSAGIAGLGALLGRPGLALGAIVVFLVGNAISGVATAPQLLPKPWGMVGQWLPPGAGTTLVRCAAYFAWHGAARVGAILGGWAVVGLLLVSLFGGGRRRAEPSAEMERPEVPIAGGDGGPEVPVAG
jgi:hypothetical protein